ncbi:MAG: hypothetical protein OEW00_07640 [candidate division Zixibacteria bacterium]|nr:hypothetical protein [candidate division Zixibacteria bacterium]
MKKYLLVAFCVVILTGCGKEPQTFEELKAAGRSAFLDDDYARAREYLTRAVALQSSDRSVLFFLGLSYQRDYIFDSALFYLKRVDILYPDDREVNLELYKVCLAMEDWRNAIRSIGVLVKTGDKAEDYYPQLAELNLKLENLPNAYYFSRETLKLFPDNPNYYLQLANVAAELDSLDISLATIDSALTRFGERDELLLNKGLYLVARNRPGDAERIFRDLAAKDTSFIPYRINLANALSTQKSTVKKAEALELYRQLQPLVGGEQFRIDSMIGVLEKELADK